MRVAVAGATGVLGRSAMPALRAAGHEVRGFSRSGGGGDLAALDVFDREALLGLAADWRPEAILFESQGPFLALKDLLVAHCTFGAKVHAVQHSRDKAERIRAFGVHVEN